MSLEGASLNLRKLFFDKSTDNIILEEEKIKSSLLNSGRS